MEIHFLMAASDGMAVPLFIPVGGAACSGLSNFYHFEFRDEISNYKQIYLSICNVLFE